MVPRSYDPDRDADAVKQMWIEAGWGSYSDEERLFVESQRTLVAEFGGRAAAMVASSRGDMRYLRETLPLSGIGAVITDLTARRQGLSSRLTARRVALDALEGAAVCALGAFEDGYYLDNVRLETGFRRGILPALTDRRSGIDID